MSPHDWSEGTRRALDLTTFAFAGVAAISLSQTALLLSCCAALVSIAVGLVRLYDRLKYGKRD